MEAWRHILEGAKMKFEIWMEHKNLEYFMSSHKHDGLSIYLGLTLYLDTFQVVKWGKQIG